MDFESLYLQLNELPFLEINSRSIFKIFKFPVIDKTIITEIILILLVRIEKTEAYFISEYLLLRNCLNLTLQWGKKNVSFQICFYKFQDLENYYGFRFHKLKGNK